MTLRSVSATQIKQHRSCALQWYLQRVEGWQMPQSPSQALGEAIHKQVEDYLLEGQTPELPSVANAIAKGLVPPTGGAYLVEEPKDYGMRLLCADVPVKGRIDLLIPPATGESLVKVVDWKSASSFRYVPEPDVLTRDVQGVLYLKYAFENYPFATQGQFRHVYILTKGTGSKKVDADVVDRTFVDAQWSHLETTVEEMKATATRSLPVVAQTQANLSHCSNYGGCSFRDRCPAASKGLVESMLEAESQTSALGEGVDMTTLAEKLKARKLATASSPSLGATTSVDAVGSTEATDVPVVTTAEVIAPFDAPQVVVAEPLAPVLSETAPPVAIGVIPPDAPGGNLVPEKAEGIEPKGLMATLAARRSTPKASEPIVTPKMEVEYEEVVKTVDPEVKEMVESAREAWKKAGGSKGEVEVAKASAATVAPSGTTDHATSETLSLFIDCYPERAAFESLRALEDEIAARTPSLLEHLRKSSPKDVPEGTVDLGEVLFGRGYSTLAASFVIKPISGPWTVSTLGPASSKVLEVLLPKATFVVRGRR